MLDELIREADIMMYEEKRSIKSPDFSVIKKKLILGQSDNVI